jgi:pimeloyl-ACP methyl ester carboxylesterase
MTKTIICSHGFGVRWDSRGMFPELAAAFPADDFRMFDYNEVDKSNGNTTVSPFSEQAKRLQKQIDAADGEITLLCHSQGSMIAGLVDLSKVSKVILLAPPVAVGMQRALKKMRLRIGSVYNPDGVSMLPRSDGTTSFIPKEYLAELEQHDPMELYQKIADTKPTTIVRCTKDEVVGLTNVNEIKNATHIDLGSDHNFTGIFRQQLIEILHDIL